jgi:hypothetical protein
LFVGLLYFITIYKKNNFMATFNTNYEAKILPAGSYTASTLGDGFSATTVHQVFCVSAGTISMTALGGGTFAWGATPGQSIDILLGSCIVSSGLFVGFKNQNQPGSQKPYYRY